MPASVAAAAWANLTSSGMAMSASVLTSARRSAVGESVECEGELPAEADWLAVDVRLLDPMCRAVVDESLPYEVSFLHRHSGMISGLPEPLLRTYELPILRSKDAPPPMPLA
ncbi:hypothetical protein DC31_05525 [Microbacterium sp. CH12i]|nr:hypothetical protein DC31_05525 [Microbacterium sp. CH12i]